MVGEMANSKRHKLVCCLMAMVLLLSFFYVVPDPAGRAERGNAAVCVADGQSALTGEMRHEGSWQNMMSAQTLLEARDAKPDACTDTFTMIHSVLDEVVMREQAGMRSLLSKLLAVVMWVMLQNWSFRQNHVVECKNHTYLKSCQRSLCSSYHIRMTLKVLLCSRH